MINGPFSPGYKAVNRDPRLCAVHFTAPTAGVERAYVFFHVNRAQKSVCRRTINKDVRT